MYGTGATLLQFGDIFVDYYNTGLPVLYTKGIIINVHFVDNTGASALHVFDDFIGCCHIVRQYRSLRVLKLISKLLIILQYPRYMFVMPSLKIITLLFQYRTHSEF